MESAAPEKQKGIGKAAMVEIGITDELRKLGWRIEKLASGYSAYEISGDRKIGPARSINALKTQVMLASGPAKGNGKAAEADDEPEGTIVEEFPSTRLPGMEEPAIEALDRQADECIEALKKKKEATAFSKDQDDIMRQKMREHGRKRYTRRGWSIVLEESEKLVIKKAEPAPPKNPSTKKDRPIEVVKKDAAAE